MPEILFQFRITPNYSGSSPIKSLLGFDVPIPADWSSRFSRSSDSSLRLLQSAWDSVAKVQRDGIVFSTQKWEIKFG